MKTNKLSKCLFFMSLLVFMAACEDRSFPAPFAADSRSVKFNLDNISGSNSLSRSSSGSDSLLSSYVTPLETDGRTLYLHTSISTGIDRSRLGKDESVTRATPVSDMNTYGSFSVFAAYYQNAWSPDSQYMNFMYHVPVSLAEGLWSPQADYYWPGSGYNVRFFAYAPIDEEFETSSQNEVANDFHIKYNVPTDVSKQKDLLIAKSVEYPGNHSNSVSLKFKHVLTAVKFVVGNDMKAGTVKSVTFRNISSVGTYAFETGSVTSTVPLKDFGQELNKVTDGTPGSAITEPSQTFMLPPQSFNDESSVIEIVFTDNEGEHTLTASLKGQTWISGTTVTYTISTSSINWDYTLVVVPPAEFDYTGGTNPYHVTSYRQNSKGVKEPANWTAQFSTDNGTSWTDTPPEWLPAFTTSDAGGTTPQSYNATVSAQIGTDSNNPHTTYLQKTPAKGSVESPYNLANQTDGGSTIENTANCYVVNAPGHYSFPLVYGNAIKGGVTNTSAYSSKDSDSSILNTFINHTGKGITDPYISRNVDCVPVKAELVWQDAPNLITDIKYDNTANGYISFKVDNFSIRQGNAIIAIKDVSNQVLWSWHIWVTDEDISKTIEVTNHQKHKYKFMPVNLGWCDGCVTTFAERSCKVKFTAGNQEKEMTVRQVPNSITTRGNNPYFQWGRKDPFLPSNGIGDINKIGYDKDGKVFSSSPSLQDNPDEKAYIRSSILNPNKMLKAYLGKNIFRNLWSANNTVTTGNDNPVIKTIYDPSPVGFKLPASNAFTGFTKDGYISSPNGRWDELLKGWSFFTNPNRDKTIFFPALGYREYEDGKLYWVTSIGYYWTAIPQTVQKSRNLEITSHKVDPLSNSKNACGFGIRSSQE